MSINDDVQNVFMIVRFDIYSETNNFTNDQKKTLSSIMDKTNDIDFKTINPVKLAMNVKKTDKILKEFEKQFAAYGGNVKVLEDKLNELKKNKIKVLSELYK